MSESDSPVGKLCDVCETEVRAKPEIYQLGIQDRETYEVVTVPVPTEAWCCDCGPGVFEDAFAFKINEARCEYHGDLSPSRIRKLRERLGLSQEELASLLGTEPTNVPRWEAGEFHPQGANEKLLLKMEEEVCNV